MLLLLGLLAVAVVMFTTGLGARAGDLRRLAAMPGPALYGLAAQVIGLPLVTVLVGSALDVAPYHGGGLMLLAMSPATIASHVLVRLGGGDIGLARSLTVTTTLIWLPVMLVFGALAMVPAYWLIALLGVLLPMAAGVILARRDPMGAARLKLRCAVIGSVLTGLLLVGTLLRGWAWIPDPALLLSVLLLALLAPGAGLLAWPLFGRGTALTLALSTGLRNLALPLALGAVLDFALPAALYGIVMYVLAFALLAAARLFR